MFLQYCTYCHCGAPTRQFVYHMTVHDSSMFSWVMIEMTRIVTNEKCLVKGILNQLTSSSAIVAFDIDVLSNVQWDEH